MNQIRTEAEIKRARIVIICSSIAIPLVVAILFGVSIPGVNLSFLPPFYASLNGITAFLLIVALVAIKNKQRTMHERAIKVCMLLSLVFLACYVAYHMTSVSTKYGDLNHDGIVDSFEAMKVSSSVLFYRILLISHIVLSTIIVPFVLFSYLHAWKGDFVTHKKWTRIAWPMWMYVAITGVVVYFMISPYYAK